MFFKVRPACKQFAAFFRLALTGVAYLARTDVRLPGALEDHIWKVQVCSEVHLGWRSGFLCYLVRNIIVRNIIVCIQQFGIYYPLELEAWVIRRRGIRQGCRARVRVPLG